MAVETAYIRAGWLIDGSGGPVQEDVLLAIAGGRISAMTAFAPGKPPPTALLTDLSSCTLLPPLVDCHVHLALSGTTDPEARRQQLAAGYDFIGPLIARNIRDAFTHGVLAVRDGGDGHSHVLRYVQENGGRDREPVQVKTSGRAWHRQGRYGAMLGSHPGAGQSLADALANDAEPVDQVKILNSGPNSLRRFAWQTPPQFAPEELREAIRLAGQQGRKVMVHANGELPVRQAVAAGCHSIEHGYFMGRENLALMAATGTVWVPTLAAMKACAAHLNPGDRHTDRTVAWRTLQHQLEQVALARDLGVTIALGTDAGSIGVVHGEAVNEELGLLIEAGCTLTEAIRCATWNGASLLGVEERLGLIARNRSASFLVMHGTPDQLTRGRACLEAIYLNGSPCPGQFFHRLERTQKTGPLQR